jgi:hypothetical protein
MEEMEMIEATEAWRWARGTAEGGLGVATFTPTDVEEGEREGDAVVDGTRELD